MTKSRTVVLFLILMLAGACSESRPRPAKQIQTLLTNGEAEEDVSLSFCVESAFRSMTNDQILQAVRSQLNEAGMKRILYVANRRGSGDLFVWVIVGFSANDAKIEIIAETARVDARLCPEKEVFFDRFR